MDPVALLARIEELEARVAFQDHALAELSDALAESRMERQRHAALLQRMLEELRQQRSQLHADATDEPPPPHY